MVDSGYELNAALRQVLDALDALVACSSSASCDGNNPAEHEWRFAELVDAIEHFTAATRAALNKPINADDGRLLAIEESRTLVPRPQEG
jgi:uncharacterized membrane-anchored protein